MLTPIPKLGSFGKSYTSSVGTEVNGGNRLHTAYSHVILGSRPPYNPLLYTHQTPKVSHSPDVYDCHDSKDSSGTTMNLLRRIIGTSTTDEIASIPSGRLFLTRSPKSPKGAYECLYNDAYALIRKTTTANFYQLCVTRVYEEGEDVQNSAFDDSDDDDELQSQASSRDTSTNKDEWKFAITDELKICRYDKSDGSVGISWQDLNGDLGDEFEFVVDLLCKQPQINSFVLALYKCLYEQRYQQSSIGVADAELLKEFAIDPKRRHQSLPYDDLEKSINLLPHENETDSGFEDELLGKAKPGTELSGCAKVVYHNSNFSLHLFDPQTDTFRTRLELGKADLKVYDVGGWVYTIIIQEVGSNSIDRVHISQGVSETINPTFNYEYHSFIFNHYTVDSTLSLQGNSWLVKFLDFDELLKFQIEFMKVMWQSLHKQEYSVSKPDEEYLANAMRDMDIDDEEDDDEYKLADGEEEQDIDKLIESRIRGRSETATYSDDEYGDDDDAKRDNEFQTPAETNSGLSVGTTNNLSFVVRGNKIGVFDTDSKLNFKTSINNLKDLEGKRFLPKTTLLHQQDQFMVMSNKSQNDKSLYKMDLNRGEIIEEWKIDDDYPLVSYAPNSKYSQLTNEQTLTGIHADGLFRIDPRLSGNKLEIGRAHV